MIVKNSIKDLGVSLEELYNGDTQIKFGLKIGGTEYPFNVVLKDVRDKVDCSISSFTANIYTRTKKGMNYEMYSTLSTLQCQIVKSIKNNINVDDDCELTFRLCEEVFSI